MITGLGTILLTWFLSGVAFWSAFVFFGLRCGGAGDARRPASPAEARGESRGREGTLTPVMMRSGH